MSSDREEDLKAVTDRLSKAAQAREQSGQYPVGLDDVLDEHFRRLRTTQEREPDELEVLLLRMSRALEFSPDRIPYQSSLPLGSQLHRSIGKAVARQTVGILLQVRDFAEATRDLVAAIVERLPEQERALATSAQLNARVDSMLDQLHRAILAERLASGETPHETERRPDGGTAVVSQQAFMARFRGSRETILERYAGLADRLTGNAPVVDLGCGRGEMLQLLAERGVEGRGVDLDPDVAAECRQRGFQCTVAEGTDYLRACEEGSLGAIFAGQIVEHLEAEDLIALVAAARRALREGGKLIIETINPNSLYVFAHAYFLDPSHVHPVPPAYLEFLCERAGFHSLEVELRGAVPAAERLEPVDGAGDVPEVLISALNRNFERLNSLLYAPQDYALIATR